MARVIVSRFRERLTGKTKVEKLQEISDDELYGVSTSSEDVLKDKNVLGIKKAKRSMHYEMNDTSKGNMTWFALRTEAWKRTLASGKKQEKKRSEINASCAVTSKGKIYQKWNAKTGKEIKSETVQFPFSEAFDEYPASFVNKLTPPTRVTFDTYQSYRQSCDPAFVLEREPDNNGTPTYHVTLNVTAAKAWEKPKNNTTIKSTVIDFFRSSRESRKQKWRKFVFERLPSRFY